MKTLVAAEPPEPPTPSLWTNTYGGATTANILVAWPSPVTTTASTARWVVHSVKQ